MFSIIQICLNFAAGPGEEDQDPTNYYTYSDIDNVIHVIRISWRTLHSTGSRLFLRSSRLFTTLAPAQIKRLRTGAKVLPFKKPTHVLLGRFIVLI